MVWCKLSDDFPDECQGLSNGAFRTHVEGLCYVMRKETGGSIKKSWVKRFAESPTFEADIAELVAHGFWADGGDQWTIRHHMEYQIEPEVLARRRADTAERQKRFRLKKAGLAPQESSAPVPWSDADLRPSK